MRLAVTMANGSVYAIEVKGESPDMTGVIEQLRVNAGGYLWATDRGERPVLIAVDQIASVVASRKIKIDPPDAGEQS